MANKIKCTCGHSWDKSDSSKKDAYVCHLCGKNNMKDGGWLDKYNDDIPKAQKGKEVDKQKVLTYKNNPDWFDNHAVYYRDDPKWDELVRKKVYAGTHGFNPETGALVNLKSSERANVPKATQEKATVAWGKKSMKQRFDSNTPAGKEVRKQAVAQGMQEMVKNPLLYVPAAIAASPFVAGAAVTSAPIVGAAMNAPILGVPGLTTSNLLTAGFATHGLKKLPSTIQSFKNAKTKDDYINATADAAWNALDIAPMASQVLKGLPSVVNDVRKTGQYLKEKTALKKQLTSLEEFFKGKELKGYLPEKYGAYKGKGTVYKGKGTVYKGKGTVYKGKGTVLNNITTGTKVVDPETGVSKIVYDLNIDDDLSGQDYTKLLQNDEAYNIWAEKIYPGMSNYVSPEELRQAHKQSLDYFKNGVLSGSGGKEHGLFIRNILKDKIPEFTNPVVRNAAGELTAGYGAFGQMPVRKEMQDLLEKAGYDVSKLTPEDWNIIDAYTKGYDNSINELLRGRQYHWNVSSKAPVREFYTNQAELLKKAILKNKAQEPIQTIRGVYDYPVDLLHPETHEPLGVTKLRSELEKGDVFKDKSFMSTETRIRDYANFGTPVASELIDIPGGGVQSIAIPEASSFPRFPGENEIILPPGLVRRVEETGLPLEKGFRFRTSILNPYTFTGLLGAGAASSAKKKNGGWLDKYQDGGEFLGTTNKGFNYNGAWGGPSTQMGGTLPGASGFMYARTGAPSNGPYAKKTKASAENGMTFYQHGLDWKPRNISQNGSIIEDDMGQWAYPGQITKINSNDITMEGVPYPVLGISDTGDTQMMYPDENYTFDGESVTEYPMMQMGGNIQDKGQLNKLDQLTNFTNYNNMAKKGKKLKKAQVGSYIGGERIGLQPIDHRGAFDELNYSITGRTPEDMANRKSVGSQIADTLKDFKLEESKSGKPKLPKGEEGNPENLEGISDLLSPGAAGAGGSEAASLAMMVKRGGKMRKAQLGDFMASNANDITGVVQGAGKVIGAVSEVADAIKAKKEAKQSRALSDLTLKASGTRPEETKRKYVRPEDQLVDPGQTFPTMGTGTEFLQLQDGGVINQIGGNPTEIQNMYNPGDLYSQLGYEPLMDSDQMKNYRYGGKAQLGVGMVAQGVGAAAQLLGGLTSGIINIGTNRMLKETEKNLGAAAFQQGMQSQQAASPFMKDGGYLSNNWQPQVITQFGGNKVSDLLKPDPTMNTLRAGGNVRDIRSNYMGDDEYMGMMAMGGQLKTHWGGGAELMSYNPYTPGSGETWMLRGQSHDETDGRGRSGIGITYGNSMVEAERGEPISEVEDGGQIGESAVVYGNLPISDFSAAELNDPKAKGKKFKNYVADLAKKEKKSNRTMDKAMDLLEDVKGNNPFNMLSLSTAQVMITGADMTLKDIAMKKRTAAQLQDVFNHTAEEHGLSADALAAGRIKQAKYDENGEIAQKGKKVKKTPAPSRPIVPFDASKIQRAPIPPIVKADLSKIKMPDEKAFKEALDQQIARWTAEADRRRKELLRQRREKAWTTLGDVTDVALPFVRASNQKPLSAEQIIPEMTALGLNQLEPVQAQLYQPMLTQASKLSIAQPKINEINAQFNAMQKTIGNNPAALDFLAGQKYKAISQAIGEEFAANQQRQDAVQAGNIGTLNDAALKNLAILDTQFQRQAQAKSATKAQALSALSSIAEKTAQNKLENLTMGVYENMYNYRFGPKGVAYNLNPLARFNMEGSGTSSSKSGNLSDEYDYSYDAYGNITDARKKSKKESQKNGGIVKAIKNL